MCMGLTTDINNGCNLGFEMTEFSKDEKVLVPFFGHWSTALYVRRLENGNHGVIFDPEIGKEWEVKEVRAFDLAVWHTPYEPI